MTPTEKAIDTIKKQLDALTVRSELLGEIMATLSIPRNRESIAKDPTEFWKIVDEHWKPRIDRAKLN